MVGICRRWIGRCIRVRRLRSRCMLGGRVLFRGRGAGWDFCVREMEMEMDLEGKGRIEGKRRRTLSPRRVSRAEKNLE